MAYNQTDGATHNPGDVGHLVLGVDAVGKYKTLLIGTAGALATTSADNSFASGVIDALNETVECVVSAGAGTVGCQLTGDWAAAGDLITFEATTNGTDWVSIYTSMGASAVIITGQNGIYQLGVAGYIRVRVRGSTWGSPGTCNVSFNSTVGPSAVVISTPLPQGANALGSVIVSSMPPITSTQGVLVAGTATIGAIKLVTGTASIGSIAGTVQTVLSPLVMGTSAIGSVNVTGTVQTVLSPLVMGTSAIGSVNVTGTVQTVLSPLVMGTSAIGSVNVTGTVQNVLSPLVTGTSQIGSVLIGDVYSVKLASGTSNIGFVTTTLAPLSSGTSQIGSVLIGNTPTVLLGPGTTGIGSITPATTGGLSTYHLVCGTSTNNKSVKSTEGQLFGWYLLNSNTNVRKLALHNGTGMPGAGISLYFTLVLPGGAAANVFNDIGITFPLGIGITTTAGIADNDATGILQNDLNINLFYK